MMKIKKQIGVHTEKITDEQFDDVIGHCEVERKYFTIANNNLIYKRLREETDINELPYLGVTVDFGLGNVCLEENVKDGHDIFKFYVIDRTTKFDYQEFNNIEDAIEKLINYYEENEMVSNPEAAKAIFKEVLNLTKDKKLSLNKNNL